MHRHVRDHTDVECGIVFLYVIPKVLFGVCVWSIGSNSSGKNTDRSSWPTISKACPGSVSQSSHGFSQVGPLTTRSSAPVEEVIVPPGDSSFEAVGLFTKGGAHFLH